MSIETYPSWVFTDRDGREWEVTEKREYWTPRENPYRPHGVHTWTFEEGEITQDLYAHKVEPLTHREDIKVQLQALVDDSNGRNT